MMRARLAPIGLALSLACSTLACAPNRGAAFEKALAGGRQAYHEGQFEAAADRFDEAGRTAKVPRDAVYARYEAALARARAGDIARAARELRAIADAKPPTEYSAQAAYKAADLALGSDAAAGYAELESTMLRFPESGVAKVALGRILRHDDETGEATTLAYLDTLLPKVEKNALAQDVTYERAKRLAALGRSEQARDAFLDVANRWPYPTGEFFDDSLFRAAEMEEKLGHPREAIAHLERLLSFRESSVTIGTYERPRYISAILEIAKIYEERLNDREEARETLHRLYTDFKTSTFRDDALWREAQLWTKDGNNDAACDRLSTLASDFPDSRYVPCAIDRCPSIKRAPSSKAPKTCHPYLTREPEKGESQRQQTEDVPK